MTKTTYIGLTSISNLIYVLVFCKGFSKSSRIFCKTKSPISSIRITLNCLVVVKQSHPSGTSGSLVKQSHISRAPGSFVKQSHLSRAPGSFVEQSHPSRAPGPKTKSPNPSTRIFCRTVSKPKEHNLIKTKLHISSLQFNILVLPPKCEVVYDITNDILAIYQCFWKNVSFLNTSQLFLSKVDQHSCI